MIDAPRLIAALPACALVVSPPGAPADGSTKHAVIAASPEDSMVEGEITVRETTQPSLSGHLVGVSNIWERNLPDDHGIVAQRMSAQLSILEVATRATRTEYVAPGSTLTLGQDRYRVISVSEGRTAPGMIVLRKLTP